MIYAPPLTTQTWETDKWSGLQKITKNDTLSGTDCWLTTENNNALFVTWFGSQRYISFLELSLKAKYIYSQMIILVSVYFIESVIPIFSWRRELRCHRHTGLLQERFKCILCSNKLAGIGSDFRIYITCVICYLVYCWIVMLLCVLCAMT